jgi:hypothetical protein
VKRKLSNDEYREAVANKKSKYKQQMMGHSNIHLLGQFGAYQRLYAPTYITFPLIFWKYFGIKKGSLLCYLVWYYEHLPEDDIAKQDGWFFLRVSTVQDALQMSHMTQWRYIKEFEQEGMLRLRIDRVNDNGNFNETKRWIRLRLPGIVKAILKKNNKAFTIPTKNDPWLSKHDVSK